MGLLCCSLQGKGCPIFKLPNARIHRNTFCVAQIRTESKRLCVSGKENWKRNKNQATWKSRETLLSDIFDSVQDKLPRDGQSGLETTITLI